jgi:hypothetical protein
VAPPLSEAHRRVAGGQVVTGEERTVVVATGGGSGLGGCGVRVKRWAWVGMGSHTRVVIQLTYDGPDPTIVS